MLIARITPLALLPHVVDWLPECEIPDFLRSIPPRCDRCWAESLRQRLYLDSDDPGFFHCSSCANVSSEQDAQFDGILYPEGMKTPQELFSRFVLDRVIELRSLPEDQLSPGEHDATVLLSLPFLHPQRYEELDGLEGYLKDRLPPVATGEFLGSPGERIDFSAHVDRVVPLGPGDYGEQFLICMTTVEGNSVVWKTGETCTLDEGKDYRLRATVMKDGGHRIYRGKRQTRVQRAKVL